jgi:hypothetical protein
LSTNAGYRKIRVSSAKSVMSLVKYYLCFHGYQAKEKIKKEPSGKAKKSSH